MAVKPFVRTSTLQQSQAIVDRDGRPAAWFVRLINDNNNNVVQAINAIAVLPQIQQALVAAQQAAADATQAAADANTAAAAAQAQTDATKREASLQASYIDPLSVLTADASTITIAAHTRIYPDAVGGPSTSVAVAGGVASPTGTGVTNYVSYTDPTRSGGSVTYLVTTTQPIQTGSTHVVGAVTIPVAGDPVVDGGYGPSPPGRVLPQKFGEQELSV